MGVDESVERGCSPGQILLRTRGGRNLALE